MWREDDFQDNGRQIKTVVKDKAGELINDPGLEPEATAERAEERARELSH